MATFIGDGTGNDFAGTPGESNRLVGRGGDDTLTGADLTDTIDGGFGADLIEGGGGDDLILISGREAFADSIFGGADGGIGARDVVRNVGAGDLIFGDGFTFAGIERLYGNDADIRFVGGGELDLTVVWLVDVDRIFGSAAADSLSGGIADERIYGRGGDDSLGGGNNWDTLYGGIGADTLDGDDANDRLFGGDGADRMNGGVKRDRLFAGLGDDTLVGGTKRDHLFGGAENDRLFGGLGDDRLAGGLGADRLAGGDAPDVFLYRSVAESVGDAIVDFQVGEDLIDLSAIDAVAGGTDDAFTYLGQVPLSGSAGDLVLQEIAGSSGLFRLLGDVDGDGTADFRIRLNLGAGTLFSGDDLLA